MSPCELHASSPPLKHAALQHMVSKVLDGLNFGQAHINKFHSVDVAFALDGRRTNDEAIVFISQSLRFRGHFHQ